MNDRIFTFSRKLAENILMFCILQMVGLLFVIFGVWIYNDIIVIPIIRQAIKRGASLRSNIF